MEPRLLLSADPLPVDGILEVVGTETDDAVLVRTFADEAGAPRLSVALNGVPVDYALEDIAVIKVELRGGDDTLALYAPSGIALPGVQTDLGEGDNRLDADLVNPSGMLRVLAGGGHDVLCVQAQWDAGSEDDHPDFLWLPTVVSGAGDDRVSVGVMAIGAASPRASIQIDTADGDDSVRLDVEGSFQDLSATILTGDGRDITHSNVNAVWLTTGFFEVDTGADRDAVDLQVSDWAVPAQAGYVRPVTFQIITAGGDDRVAAAFVDLAGDIDFIADTGEGHDAISVKYSMFLADGEPVRSQVGKVDLATGAGDDTLLVETLLGADSAEREYDVRIDAGEGDNEAFIRFGDGARGARPPSGRTLVSAEYRSGAGNDRVSFDWLDQLERELILGIDMRTGGGDDRLYAQSRAQHASRTGKFTQWDYDFQLGGGNDFAAIGLYSSGEGAGINRQTDLVVEAGLGTDAVSIDADGGVAEFAALVDLGADANEVAMETLTLSYEDTTLGASVVGSHQWQYGWGDAVMHEAGAKAVYAASLRSSEEGMAIAYHADTIAGDVGDSVEIQIGGAQTQTVGSSMSVNVGDHAAGWIDHDESITIHSGSTEGAQANVRVDIEGLQNTTVATTVAVASGGEQPGDVERIFVDNTRTVSAGVAGMLDVLTGGGDDVIAVMLHSFSNDAVRGAMNAMFDLGAGDDAIAIEIATNGNRSDAIAADMGIGADRFALDWKGSLQDPTVDLAISVEIAFGGADGRLPEVGDDVRVTFGSGDANSPYVMGILWNGEDKPPPDDGATPADDKRLSLALESAGGIVGFASELVGGAGSEAMQLFFQGKLKVSDAAPAPQLDVLIDLGGGDDHALIDFSGLEVEGSKKLAPIGIELRGGGGSDTLEIFGTEGADRLTATNQQLVFPGVAELSYVSFERLVINALGGDDRVMMISADPDLQAVIDGGAGRDRFEGYAAGGLTLLDFEQVKLKPGGAVAVVPSLAAAKLAEPVRATVRPKAAWSLRIPR